MTKKTVVVLRGLPASGKTTYVLECIAKSPEDSVRINNDDLAAAIYGKSNTHHTAESSRTLASVRESMLKTFLDLPHIKYIYVDNTNLNVDTVRALEKITLMRDHNFIVFNKFMDVSAEECIKRDALRENPVGESVIQKMDKQKAKLSTDWAYMNVPHIEEYFNDPLLPSAVICDLDGTIADGTGHRGLYEYDKVYSDRIKRNVLTDVINAASGGRLIFVTGRPDSCREATNRWLRDALNLCMYPGTYDLYMRPSYDYRQDWIVKHSLFQKHIAGDFSIKSVFDDRNQVVEMWRKLGLQTYQVSNGDF